MRERRGHGRREDQLTELLELGSRNFRRYRRRAYLAFAVLTLTNALALYLVVHSSQVQNRRSAERARDAAIQSKQGCERATVAVPTLVKVMKIGALADKRAPGFIPPELRITPGEIAFYQSLQPKHC